MASTAAKIEDTQHTPGPWRYDVESEAVFHDDGVVCPNIAFLSDNTSGERNLADGTLIAAAPQMLAALQSAEIASMELCVGQDHANQCWVTLKEIRGAIAAAGGHVSLAAREAA